MFFRCSSYNENQSLTSFLFFNCPQACVLVGSLDAIVENCGDRTIHEYFTNARIPQTVFVWYSWMVRACAEAGPICYKKTHISKITKKSIIVNNPLLSVLP